MNTSLSFKEFIAKSNAVVRSDGNRTVCVCLVFGLLILILSFASWYWTGQSLNLLPTRNHAPHFALFILLSFLQSILTVTGIYGLCVHALKNLRGNAPRLTDLFAGFGRPLFKLICIPILLLLIIFVCSLVLMTAACIAAAVIALFSHSDSMVYILPVILFPLIILGFLFLAVMYLLYEYVIYDNRSLGVIGVMKRSRELTRGTRFFAFRICLFYFGLMLIAGAINAVPFFYGWIKLWSATYILTYIVSAFISLVFILPRFMIACTLYYEAVRKAYEEAHTPAVPMTPETPQAPAGQ